MTDIDDGGDEMLRCLKILYRTDSKFCQLCDTLL